MKHCQPLVGLCSPENHSNIGLDLSLQDIASLPCCCHRNKHVNKGRSKVTFYYKGFSIHFVVFLQFSLGYFTLKWRSLNIQSYQLSVP